MAGRPPKYDNVKSLIKKIDEYFENLKSEKKNPSITGLALYLGFESRQSFYDYEKHEEFSYVIKKARLQIENFYEEKLLSRNTVGAIFALKNMGWSDKQEIQGQLQINELPFNNNYVRNGNVE